MNPFSPFYYLRENKTRTAALVFVMSLSMLSYLTGLYASNLYIDNIINIESYRDFTVIAAREEEESKEQLNDLLENNPSAIDGMRIIPVDYFADYNMRGQLSSVGNYSGVFCNTIMGIRAGSSYPVFHDAEEFREFTGVLGLPYNRDEDKVIIMGNKLARNFGFRKGDTVSNDSEGLLIFGFKNPLTLAETYDESGHGVPGQYTYFRVDSDYKPSDDEQPNAVLLLRKEGSGAEITAHREELTRAVENLKIRYDKLIYIDHAKEQKGVENTYKVFWPLFRAPLLMIGAVLVLTSAGIFSVALEKREFEFSVYKALGFSRSSVLLKSIAEILVLNILSVVVGVIVIIITVASVNELLLHKRGLELQYYSELALTSYILCNIAVFVPLVTMQVHKIIKSNVVRY